MDHSNHHGILIPWLAIPSAEIHPGDGRHEKGAIRRVGQPRLVPGFTQSELNETLRYLEKDVNETERRAFRKDSVGTRTGNMDGSIQQSHQYSVAGKDGTVYSSFELKTITIKPSQMPKE